MFMSILAAFMVPHPPMIVPAVGRGGEKEIEETTRAYEQVASEIALLKPETIIISSPHSVMYSDYFHISPGKSARGSFDRFGAGQISFREEYDEELAQETAGIAERNSFPAGFLGERDSRLDHGVMVPLYFIRKKYDGFRILRVGLSGLPLTDHYRFGQMIAEAANRLNRSAVFVASGDLSHKLQSYGPYGFAAEGPMYDERIMDVCGRGAFGELFDFDEAFCDKAAECGHRSFVIMAGALDGRAVKATRLSHQDVTGVGYGICTFYPGEADPNRRFLDRYLSDAEKLLETKRQQSDEYVRLASAAVDCFVRNNKKIRIPEGLPSEMLNKQAGVFVSIHEHGRLRGCIGTFLPTTNCIAQEIIDNAISAASRDPRFDPISANELKWLDINVDVLSAPEPVSSKELLDAKRYGVIVTSGHRRGLLLPDLDGVDTVDEQLAIAKKKASIREGEPCSLQRFEVVRHR
jgi:AmmeMemoRadiSam system protein A/AmmeMemoRadiSam system protein B